MATTNLIDSENNAPSPQVPPTQVQNNAGTLKRRPTQSPHSPTSRKLPCQKIGDANLFDPFDPDGVLYSKVAKLLPNGTLWPSEIEDKDFDFDETTPLQRTINMVDKLLCIKTFSDNLRKENDELRTALSARVESFNNLKAIAIKEVDRLINKLEGHKRALKQARGEVQVAQAEVTAAKEKITILEAASNEEKIERLITESKDRTEALKMANDELQVAWSDLGTALVKNNLLQASNNESMTTINRLRAENEDHKRALSRESSDHLLTQAELNFAKNKNSILEAAADEWNNFTKKLKVECEEHTKDLKLAKAELKLLHKLVASSATVEAQLVDASLNDISDIENSAVSRNLESLRESYYRCVLENRRLKMEVGTQRIKLESCQEQSRLNQKKLNDENKELKTKLYEMAGNLDMLSKQLKDKANDMEFLNQVS